MLVQRAVSYAVLGAVALVHLVAQLVAPEGTVASLTQPLLMPALAAVLVAGTTAPRPPIVRLTLVALVFSWLGDTVPRFLDGDASFGAMIGCFLLAQVAYVVAFRRSLDQPLVTRPALTAPYFLACGVLIALCFEGAGALIVPVVVYGAAITAMAILSTGLGRVGGIGGAVFMLSDALIALHAFAGLDLPAHSFWVMLTYVVGQTMLVVAVRSRAAVAVRKPGLQSTA
ncbi:lysoplasmalogenase [Nocardioides oleivorans]|uniref:Lysoplasmalogenase n=1 Tax=Nocardioides oleivorans TaxID=273676 RepID=A0A4Q2S3N8_9ACTN|nr:lysoplasmalogenase [Nocardioides oleivorans]RYB95055.1 lysoplasmalogenase [Nocardioides oleivorans]